MKRLTILLLLLSILGCADSRLPLRVGAHVIQVKLVDTPEARQKGLQGQKSLPNNEGMLFVFPQAESISFWAKSTLIPLDLAFISDEGKIIQIEHLPAGSTDQVVANRPVRYALEMNKGWFKSHDVGIGTPIRMEQK